MMTFKHIENKEYGKFIAVSEDGIEAGWMHYTWLDNGNLLADGTFVSEAFKGQKIGHLLFNELVDFAYEKQIKIYPSCPFIINSFAKNPELSHLLAEEYIQGKIYK